MRNLLTLILLAPTMLCAQDINENYELANNYYKRFGNKLYHALVGPKSIKDTHTFYYSTQTEKGSDFMKIDVNRMSVESIFDQSQLAEALSIELNTEIEPYKIPIINLEINASQDSVKFNIFNSKYICALSDYSLLKLHGRDAGSGYWGSGYKENDNRATKSPDGKKEARIIEGNIWVVDLKTNKSKKLSDDGSIYEYYSSHIYWSPDSRKIVSCKIRPVETRKLLMISSSPKDQLQPKIEEWDYIKPGDALTIRRPALFVLDEDESKVINIDVPDVELQYSLDGIRWRKDSKSFSFNFNKRGHQEFNVYSVDAQTGALFSIVNETSNTFIHYSKTYQKRWLEDTNELLWLSERDGWSHMYLYDTKKGTVKKQLTKGDWVVKEIVNVDEKSRNIIFKACGKDSGEDPYLEKYYSVDIDDGKILCLTPESANHNVVFTSDYKYFLDSYSRVDLVPTVVVRSAKDGQIIFKPTQQPDASSLIEAGWSTPEVFSAKGRDGVTDIWGLIIRPSNFDPNKKYPVVEYIYAGPHDSHVPKSFQITHRSSELSELGFITVMIDGMGTANRSKAFHDVCWKNIKDAGFPDRIAWMKDAASKYPEMDLERVGIYGTSAGGQNAMGALLFHPDFYKVGVASCGCHDNRMDKIWWNEQWMGYPVGKEYEESSNVVNAHLLKGDLMLMVGELDNNVDPASTYQVVDKLIEHNKEFELVVLPGQRHSDGGAYGERKRRDFFVKHLLKLATPEWNK